MRVALHMYKVNSGERVNCCSVPAGSQSRYIVAYVCAASVIVLAIYHLIREVIWFYCTVKTYLFQPQNYVEWVLYITAIIFVVFVFFNDCGCPSRWQWQVGITSIFLGWLNLIFVASQFPMISIYVIMFREIFYTFSKLILFALLLISAFSLLLFMMFHNPTSTAMVIKCVFGSNSNGWAG